MNTVEGIVGQQAETSDSHGAFLRTDEIRPDDIVIALMGLPGEGKATFVSFLCDRTAGQSQSALPSVQSEVMAIYAHDRLKGPEGRRVVLVDFPSFDGRVSRDFETLSLISTWFKTSCSDIKLSGIIYLHYLQDTIEADPLLKNLRMLGMICGDVAMKGRVVIISTTWQDNTSRTSRAIELDILAEQPCQPFMVAGSRALRLFNKTPQAVQEVVSQSINIILGSLDDTKSFLLQEELIDLRLNSNETSAGKMLRTMNSEQLAFLRKKLDLLVAQSRSTKGAPLEHDEPVKEQEELKEEAAKLRGEIRRLGIPNGRRLHLFFQHKKPRAAGITLLLNTEDWRMQVNHGMQEWLERAQRERIEREHIERECIEKKRAEREREERERVERECEEKEQREREQRECQERERVNGVSELEQFGKNLVEELNPQHRIRIGKELERAEMWLQQKERQWRNGWKGLEQNWMKEEVKKTIKEAVQEVGRELTERQKKEEREKKEQVEHAERDSREQQEREKRHLIECGEKEWQEQLEREHREQLKKEWLQDFECATTSTLGLVTSWMAKKKELLSHFQSPQRFEQGNAQFMVDFLDKVLNNQPKLPTPDPMRKYILRLLSGIAQSYQVFPQRLVLKDVDCNLKIPVNAGGAGLIYHGKLGPQNLDVCVKAIAIEKLRTGTPVDSPSKATLLKHAGELILWGHTSHKNIQPLYGAYFSDETQPRICFVSPWMDKGSLSDYLKTPDATSRIPLLLDIISGLRHLHESDIIHADLKSANILISSQEYAVLTDFGLARVAAAGTYDITTFDGNAPGTIRYMAPELFDSKQKSVLPTKRSDMWAFGCVCYEVITNKPPFYELKSEPHILHSLAATTNPPANYTPEDRVVTVTVQEYNAVWELIYGCWNREPKQRLTAADGQMIVQSLVVNDPRPPFLSNGALFLDEEQGPSFEINLKCVISILEQAQQIISPGEAGPEPVVSYDMIGLELD
ncbi:hypothetical protein NP233_g10913 [Leucocoprinus birnbaumii]|uniref:Protein kinase domain-containing protein n=1 Tax=Leucocoprinus birnbaumii TaxID=56174 RepID=A0AAD5VL58_9AGAR|nr:hypothetical protein NP233_g10913 [Leucocoprinus birnbaumii]